MDALQKHVSVGVPVAISENTKQLMASSVSQNTLRAYRRCLGKLSVWLGEQTLTDALLAEYITSLHQDNKTPSTISQVVAAVRWRAKYLEQETLQLTLTESTLAGIRREGKNRGRGQVDGLTWADVERVCAFAESDRTVAGLRDSAMIRLMSDCLLRVSEIVSINCGDIKETTIIIAGSKTDQLGVGESLYVCESTRKILQRYRDAAGITRGSVFPQNTSRGSHPTATSKTTSSTADYQKAGRCGRCTRVHLWTLSSCWFCCVFSTSRCLCC